MQADFECGRLQSIPQPRLVYDCRGFKENDEAFFWLKKHCGRHAVLQQRLLRQHADKWRVLGRSINRDLAAQKAIVCRQLCKML